MCLHHCGLHTKANHAPVSAVIELKQIHFTLASSFGPVVLPYAYITLAPLALLLSIQRRHQKIVEEGPVTAATQVGVDGRCGWNPGNSPGVDEIPGTSLTVHP